MSKLYKYDGADLYVGNYITPEMYGAVGDGVIDDTEAIQNAITSGGHVLFKTGAVYKVTSTIKVGSDVIIDLDGATIASTNNHLFFNFDSASTFTVYSGNGNITICNGTIIGGAISFAHGENIRFKNVDFRNSLNDHFLEVCACKNYIVDGCRFFGMADVQTSVYEYINIDPCTYSAFPWATSGSAFYDGTKNSGISILNCSFGLGESTYAYGYNAIGAHSNSTALHEDILISGCTLRGFTGCGIRLNDMQSVTVVGCDIRVDGDGIRVGDVAACGDVVIIDNYVTSENGEKLVITSGQYENLTVSGNVTQGYTQDF